MSATTPEADLLATIEGGSAPRRILEFAARGFVPLPPSELVRAVATIVASGDAELAALAEETFKGFDETALLGAVSMPSARSDQLDAIARRTKSAHVIEPLIRHRSVANDTLAWLAERVEGPLQDVIVTNQTRLLESPLIVERLFENPRLSGEIRRRADEFLEEFFLKKEREEEERRRAAEEAARLAGTPPPEALEAEEEPDVPLSEDEKKSLFARLSVMTVSQRIQLAYKGNKEERMFLVRDANRLVSTAVLKSPKTREADAESYATMKSVGEDVLRSIAFRKDWMRRYSILSAIVKNPRSPIDITLPLVTRLTTRDQKLLATDRNVPDAVRATARREVARKEV